MRTYEGKFEIEKPRAEVWAFVIDPNQMGTCIPDLMDLQVQSETRFRSLVRVGVGPIRGKFDLTSELSVLEDGEQASLSIKGGGMGSGVDMQAKVRLADSSVGTELSWQCDAKVSGPIASIGGRLIDGEARKITEKVFANLKEALSSAVSETAASTSDLDAIASEGAPHDTGHREETSTSNER